MVLKNATILVIDDDVDVLTALRLLLKPLVKEVVTEKNPSNISFQIEQANYDIIILDEDQHLTETNSISLLNRDLDYVALISMTGTPTQHDNKKELYKQLNLKVLFNIGITKAVDIGLLSDYTINVLNVSLGEGKNIEANIDFNKRNKNSVSDREEYFDEQIEMRAALMEVEIAKTGGQNHVQ